MDKLPLVRDHMDKIVHTLDPDTEILDAVRFLLEHRITGAPVVDQENRLLGMLGEKDCMKLISEGADGDMPDGTVRNYMRTEVRTISPDMDIYYIAGLFLQETLRRFPVVEDGKLVGAITRFDLLRVMEPTLSRERDTTD
jgi:CBS domain-containing protein